MPKKNTPVRAKVSVKKNTGNHSSRGLLIFAVLALVFAGIGYYFFVGGVSLSLPFLNPAPPKTLSLDTTKARHVMVDEKGATLHMYDAHKVLVSFYVPPNAVAKKQFFTLTPIKGDGTTQVGVSVTPADYKFSKPVSVTFDFSKSELKNSAPNQVQTSLPRQTGTSHVYAFDAKRKELSFLLVSRGMESASYLSARTMTSGVYYVHLNDHDQLYYARKTLGTTSPDTYALLESAAIVLYNNQSLSADETARVRKAIGSVDISRSPLFELYASAVVQKKLDAKTSFIPKAYANDSSLASLLQSACTETNHSLETYIVSGLLADMNGMHEISATCQSTLRNVIPKRVAELVNNPNATFDQVVTMLAQMKAIEGEDSQYVNQLENKLQKVVTADVQTFTGGNSTSVASEQVTAEMDFTTVDPSLRAALASVKASSANKQLDILLANACPTKTDLEWGKVIATQYQLNSALDKINKLLAENKDCRTVSGKGNGGDPPPPPPPGSADPSKQQPAGRCLDVNDYELSGDEVFSCKYCYDVVTNDSMHNVLYRDCEVGTGYDYCTALSNGLNAQSCDYSDIVKPGHVFDDPKDPELVPPDYGQDPPLADPNTGDTVTNDNSSNESDPPLADPQTGDTVPNNDTGN